MPVQPKHKLITKVGGNSVRRGWVRLFVVELIISISLSGVLIVVSYIWIHQETPDTQQEQSTRYCMPCVSISLNPDEDIENFRNFSFQQGEYLQCCSAVDGVPKLVALSVEKKRRRKIASGYISGVPRSCSVLDDQTVAQGSAKVVGFAASTKEVIVLHGKHGRFTMRSQQLLSSTPQQHAIEDIMPEVERFVVLVYDRASTCMTVYEACKDLFTRKGIPCDDIPSTSAALFQHIKRVAYQAGYCLGQAIMQNLEWPVPPNCCCKRLHTHMWEPFWTEHPEASDVYKQLIKCGFEPEKGYRGDFKGAAMEPCNKCE